MGMTETADGRARAAPDPQSRGGSGPRWYVVNTLPHREFRAELQLTNQGFRVFVPQRLKTVRHARKLTNVRAPFFPRYIFIELDLSYHQWRSVNGTFGVASLVMRRDLPHPVPGGVVEAMLASVDEDGLVCFEQKLKIGSSVRLTAGPFADKLGILDRLDDAGRVRVLLEIMGTTVPVQVMSQFVMPAA
jgi:transcriptional antiterminator RfaH